MLANFGNRGTRVASVHVGHFALSRSHTAALARLLDVRYAPNSGPEKRASYDFRVGANRRPPEVQQCCVDKTLLNHLVGGARAAFPSLGVRVWFFQFLKLGHDCNLDF